MSQELENTFLSALERDQHKLFRICSVYAKDSDDAKDLFQEVLIQIWKSMPSFQSRSTLETWMYRITVNVCLRFRTNNSRTKIRFISIDDNLVTADTHDSAVAERRDQLKTLKNCIKKLNEADKAVMTLYLEELPYKEISNIMGLTENAIAVKIKRIKKKLLNCINEGS